MPAHDASGLQQAACAQGRFADEQARTEADAAGELVGLRRQHRANFDYGRAKRDARARLEVEPRKQRGVGSGAECPLALRERLCERLLRIERHAAVERIGSIDRLDLDQRRTPVLRARHGAHAGSERYTAAAVEKRALVGACLAQAERECQVAAEDDAPFTRESVRKSRCDRTHAGNCHDSQRDAGDKYIESAQASAQFARRKTQGQRTATSFTTAPPPRHASARLRFAPSAAAPHGRSARRARHRG